MAKNSITDYDNTAANNTDIQSVDIDEGCAPSGINNAIRELMADLADVNDGTVPLASPDINGGTIDNVTIGGTTAGAGTFTTGTFSGNLIVDTNTLFVDSANNRVGIGTSSPSRQFHVNSGTGDVVARFESTDADAYINMVSSGGEALIGSSGNDLVMYPAGTERARVTSSGNVGIGTSSPAVKAHLYGTSGNEFLRIENGTSSLGAQALFKNPHNSSFYFGLAGDSTGDTIHYNGAASNSIFYTNATERARIDSSGRLLIGHATAKGSALDVDKANLAAASFNRTGTDGEIVALLKNGTSVGSIGTSSGLTIVSSSQLRFFTSTSNEDMRLETDGDLHVDGNVVAYSTTISDKRLKKDIQPIENALWKVNQINGCTFTYLKDDRKSAGLIAQDLEKVLPSAVIEDQAVFHGEEGETYKTVQYDQVIGLLVEAIKELNAKVEGLENGITS